jgi:prepilin-type N-terminal cleavage/methylation domain-containing protein
MSLARTRTHGRRGVTLLEIAIVLAIIGIMAGLAGTLLTENLPSWRTRRAAAEFAAALNSCRQLAVVQGVEFRVRLSASDPDLSGASPNVGVYYIERGDQASGSTDWDILPWDMDGSGAAAGEGTVEISKGGEDALNGVSIAPWVALTGVGGDDIVFSPRGWLVNPVSDFNGDGYIDVTFVNKPARGRGATDEWTVMVSRGGLVRMESSNQTAVGGASGTPAASEWMSSDASGHTP